MSERQRPLIAGNWKMNQGTNAGRDLARAVAAQASKAPNADLVVAPPYLILAAVAADLQDSPVQVAAQNMHDQPGGAFTGEVSTDMLRDAGCSWVIIGHSERRQYFGETDAGVAAKTKSALAAGLRPIVCVGETLEEREAGQTMEVVSRQLGAVIEHLRSQPGVGVIAYEPVWAIGTGKVATPAQAQEVHAAIRAQLRASSADLAEQTRVLYGGSVKPENAAELIGCEDIDGALVGGASLDADGFVQIAVAAAG